MAQMTLDEKIGQMLQPDQQYVKNIDDLETYHLGSVLSGGDSDPATGNDLKSWTDTYDRFQARALKTRLKIPLLYGVDAVHGHSNVLGAVMFPHNIGLGCTRDAALVREISRITAEEVRATGIQWAFAPCVTVPQDIRWGRSYEGFGETPDIVTPLGEASVHGLQLDDLSNPLGVLACAKHFAGDGGTKFGTGLNGKLDHGDDQIDEATFRRIHLPAYIKAIKAGAGTIMPSYNSWNGIKCSANKKLLTDILKNEFGFQGFLISDYNAIDEIPGSFKDQIRISANAGMDMFMVPDKYARMFTLLKELVNENAVPMSRIDDAVARILRVKYAMGLMDPNRSQLADRSLQKNFGSPAHRKVARQAVRESLVLLKNDHKVLPISKTVARIHVAGKNADNIGNQCGGWTIRWQGQTGDVTPGGTTILQAVKNAVSKGTKVTYSLDGSGATGATVGLLVIGEKPYAEMMGDRTELSLDTEDLNALRNMKASGIPVAVFLLSGRPLFVDEVMGDADAWVAAWLPGTEGAGVTDVLFGDFKPMGKLSFTWPKSTSTSLHIGDSGYQPLFALGYGLHY